MTINFELLRVDKMTSYHGVTVELQWTADTFQVLKQIKI